MPKPDSYDHHENLYYYHIPNGLDELTNRLLQGVKDKADSIRLLLIFLFPPDSIEGKNGQMILFIDSELA